MYVPKAVKLPSGKWRCRVVLPDGKRKSITAETKKEAERQAALLKAGDDRLPDVGRTLEQSIAAYIDERKERLSPSTVRRYRAFQKNGIRNLQYRQLNEITRSQWQAAIDKRAEKYSPKTVKNEWRFLSSVMRAEGIEPPKITLDKVITPDLKFLDFEQIPIFLNVVKGTDYEIAALLALSSLRLSEVLNVTREKIDLENNCIYVHGSAVIGPDGKLVHKEENKNETSRRTIPFILPQLRSAIERGHWRPDEYLCTFHPNSLWKAMNRLSEQAGLPVVGMHDLRRTFVSLAVHQGMSLETIRKIGGWANDTVIRQVYLKICDKDMEEQGQKFLDFFAE